MREDVDGLFFALGRSARGPFPAMFSAYLCSSAITLRETIFRDASLLHVRGIVSRRVGAEEQRNAEAFNKYEL